MTGQTGIGRRLALPETRDQAIELVSRTVALAQGSIGRAAEALGCSRRTLYRLMRDDAGLCAAVVTALAELGPVRSEGAA